MLSWFISFFKKSSFFNSFKIKEIGGILYPHEDMVDYLHSDLVHYSKNLSSEALVEDGKHFEISFHDIQSYLYSELSDLSKKEKIIVLGANLFSRFLHKGHPYVDGNKRTGFAILWLFVFMNGFEFAAKTSLNYHHHDTLIRKWADLESNKNHIEEIIDWIKFDLVIKKR